MTFCTFVKPFSSLFNNIRHWSRAFTRLFILCKSEKKVDIRAYIVIGFVGLSFPLFGFASSKQCADTGIGGKASPSHVPTGKKKSGKDQRVQNSQRLSSVQEQMKERLLLKIGEIFEYDTGKQERVRELQVASCGKKCLLLVSGGAEGLKFKVEQGDKVSGAGEIQTKQGEKKLVIGSLNFFNQIDSGSLIKQWLVGHEINSYSNGEKRLNAIQSEVLEDFRQAMLEGGGVRSFAHVATTGIGKTVVFLKVLRERLFHLEGDKGQNLSFVVSDKVNLVDQLYEEIKGEFAVEEGEGQLEVIKQEKGRNQFIKAVDLALHGEVPTVVVVTVQSFISLVDWLRSKGGGEKEQLYDRLVEGIEGIYFDEVHHIGAKEPERVIVEDLHRDKGIFLYGMTATPVHYKKGNIVDRYFGWSHWSFLDEVSQDQSVGDKVLLQIQRARDEGYVTPFDEMYVLGEPNFKVTEDKPLFVKQYSEEANGKGEEKKFRYVFNPEHFPRLIELLYPILVSNKKGMIMMPTIKNAEELALALRSVLEGVEFMSYHSEMSEGEQKGVLEKMLEPGVRRFVVAVRGIDEGVDIPEVSVYIDLNFSVPITRRIQRMGRTVRLHPGKVGADMLFLRGNFRNAREAAELLKVLELMEGTQEDGRGETKKEGEDVAVKRGSGIEEDIGEVRIQGGGVGRVLSLSKEQLRKEKELLREYVQSFWESHRQVEEVGDVIDYLIGHNTKYANVPDKRITSYGKMRQVLEKYPEIKEDFLANGIPLSRNGMEKYMGQEHDGQKIGSVENIFQLVRGETVKVRVKVKVKGEAVKEEVGDVIDYLKKHNTKYANVPDKKITTGKMVQVLEKYPEIKEDFLANGIPLSFAGMKKYIGQEYDGQKIATAGNIFQLIRGETVKVRGEAVKEEVGEVISYLIEHNTKYVNVPEKQITNSTKMGQVLEKYPEIKKDFSANGIPLSQTGMAKYIGQEHEGQKIATAGNIFQLVRGEKVKVRGEAVKEEVGEVISYLIEHNTKYANVPDKKITTGKMVQVLEKYPEIKEDFLANGIPLSFAGMKKYIGQEYDGQKIATAGNIFQLIRGETVKVRGEAVKEEVGEVISYLIEHNTKYVNVPEKRIISSKKLYQVLEKYPEIKKDFSANGIPLSAMGMKRYIGQEYDGQKIATAGNIFQLIRGETVKVRGEAVKKEEVGEVISYLIEHNTKYVNVPDKQITNVGKMGQVLEKYPEIKKDFSANGIPLSQTGMAKYIGQEYDGQKIATAGNIFQLIRGETVKVRGEAVKEEVGEVISYLIEHNTKYVNVPEKQITNVGKMGQVLEKYPEIKKDFSANGIPLSFAGMKKYIGQEYEGQKIGSVGNIFQLIRGETVKVRGEAVKKEEVGEVISYLIEHNTKYVNVPEKQITNVGKMGQVLEKYPEIKKDFSANGIPLSQTGMAKYIGQEYDGQKIATAGNIFQLIRGEKLK